MDGALVTSATVSHKPYKLWTTRHICVLNPKPLKKQLHNREEKVNYPIATGKRRLL